MKRSTAKNRTSVASVIVVIFGAFLVSYQIINSSSSDPKQVSVKPAKSTPGEPSIGASAAPTVNTSDSLIINSETFELADSYFKGHLENVQNASGDSYTGDFVDGKYEGTGKMVYKNGDVYSGDWISGVKDGVGKYSEKSGCVYEGEWAKNQKHGGGTYTCKDWSYSGDWESDTITGKGLMSYSDNSVFYGDFNAGLRNGKGEYKNTLGWKYSGDWKDDKKNGFGTYTDKTGWVY